MAPAMMTNKIGILGGTFDPIHVGHLAIAEDVRHALGLARLLVIPAAYQPLKHDQPGATAAQRLEMAQLACANNPAFEPLDIEVNRPGPSYTATTLEFLHEHTPGELYFILGADALNDLPRWRNIARVLELAQIVAVKRPGTEPDLVGIRAALPALASRLTLIEGPRLDVSSTDIRQRARDGRPIRYLVPEPVAHYIATHALYSNPKSFLNEDCSQT